MYSSQVSDLGVEKQNLLSEIQRLSRQLCRSRELNSLPQLPVASVKEVYVEGVSHDTGNQSRVSSAEKDICCFELYEEGSCQKQNKCNFGHEIDTDLRNNNDRKQHKMLEISQKIGRCAYDMVKKGSCIKGDDCSYKHGKLRNAEANSGGRRVKFCFKEVENSGSCPHGVGCKFSHDITQENRDDENFRRAIREERLSKTSKCVNEYRNPGSCRKGAECTFGHIISDAERKDPALRKKMDIRWNLVVGRKNIQDTRGEKPQTSENTNMRVIVTLLKELKTSLSTRCP